MGEYTTKDLMSSIPHIPTIKAVLVAMAGMIFPAIIFT
jgi:hypothetical protein